MQSLNIIPRVSIVLPVYNGEHWIKWGIRCVLEQSFTDFELIVVDDGSIDRSWDVMCGLSDARIRAIRRPNCGLPATLNYLIQMAKGEFIARQDQDDISFPSRLKGQVEFLEANPDVGMVGTWAEIWVGDERSDRILQHPTDDASIKFNLLFDNPFVHSSVMIRRSVFDEIGGYCEDKSRQPPEDYELWSRVARKFKMANLPEVLMAYREVPGSMSRTGLNPFLSRIVSISAENIAWYSGRDVKSPEVVAISKLAHGVYEGIPPRANFSGMASVLKDAAASIARDAGVAPQQLDALLKMRLKMLRYHYMEYRTGGWVGRLMGGRLGRYAKRVVRQMMAVMH